MKISARSSAKLQCRGKKPTSSTNHQHCSQKNTIMFCPLTRPLIRFLFRIRPPLPSLPSRRRPPPLPLSALHSRIALAAARPTTFLHYRTLIRSAVRLPPESPARSSDGGRPLTGHVREASAIECSGPAEFAATQHDLEARTHSCVRPHAGPGHV
jgi:hypothetical protein